MDINAAWLCPLCAQEFIGLNELRTHFRLVHGNLDADRQEGFLCHICRHLFPSSRAWRGHTVTHHFNEQEHAGGDDGNVDGNNIPNGNGAVNNVHNVQNGDLGGNHIPNDQNEMDMGSDGSAGDDGQMSDNGSYSGSGSDSDVEERDEDVDALENLPNGRKDAKHAAVKMIVNMRSVPAMTRVGVSRAVSGAELVLKVNNLSLKEDVAEYLRRNGQENNRRAIALLQKFDTDSPFFGIRSNRGQISGVKRYFTYLEPEIHHIDDRLDQRLCDDAAYGLVPVPNSYQHVSIIEILKLIVRKPQIMNYVRNLRPSEDGMLSCYTDSEHTHCFRCTMMLSKLYYMEMVLILLDLRDPKVGFMKFIIFVLVFSIFLLG